MLAGDLISQLHTRGGLPQWEVYVTATLPDSMGSQRVEAVRGVLARNGPHWEADQEHRDFLVEEVGVPRKWLLESLALWAKAAGNPTGRLLAIEASSLLMLAPSPFISTFVARTPPSTPFLSETFLVSTLSRSNCFPWRAGQLDHLSKAEDWPAIHTLLMSRFAARWFLGTPLERQRLVGTVRSLQPHEGQVDAALGADTFRHGAGLYAGFFFLEVRFWV